MQRVYLAATRRQEQQELPGRAGSLASFAQCPSMELVVPGIVPFAVRRQAAPIHYQARNEVPSGFAYRPAATPDRMSPGSRRDRAGGYQQRIHSRAAYE